MLLLLLGSKAEVIEYVPPEGHKQCVFVVVVVVESLWQVLAQTNVLPEQTSESQLRLNVVVNFEEEQLEAAEQQGHQIVDQWMVRLRGQYFFHLQEHFRPQVEVVLAFNCHQSTRVQVHQNQTDLLSGIPVEKTQVLRDYLT